MQKRSQGGGGEQRGDLQLQPRNVATNGEMGERSPTRWGREQQLSHGLPPHGFRQPWPLLSGTSEPCGVEGRRRQAVSLARGRRRLQRCPTRGG